MHLYQSSIYTAHLNDFPANHGGKHWGYFYRKRPYNENQRISKLVVWRSKWTLRNTLLFFGGSNWFSRKILSLIFPRHPQIPPEVSLVFGNMFWRVQSYQTSGGVWLYKEISLRCVDWNAGTSLRKSQPTIWDLSDIPIGAIGSVRTSEFGIPHKVIVTQNKP